MRLQFANLENQFVTGKEEIIVKNTKIWYYIKNQLTKIYAYHAKVEESVWETIRHKRGKYK